MSVGARVPLIIVLAAGEPTFWFFIVDHRAFPVAGCRIRNSTPRDVASAPTLAVFEQRLKTYRFLQIPRSLSS